MDVLDKIDDKLRRKAKKLEPKKLAAHDIEAQLEEIAHELDQLPTRSTDFSENAFSSVRASEWLQQMSDIGIFALILVGAVVAIRISSWVGFVVIAIASAVWIAYKYFEKQQA